MGENYIKSIYDGMQVGASFPSGTFHEYWAAALVGRLNQYCIL